VISLCTCNFPQTDAYFLLIGKKLLVLELELLLKCTLVPVR